MADVTKFAPFLLRWEGGYENSPEDDGNYNSRNELVGTNMGITPFTYELAFHKVPSVEDMKLLTQEQFLFILKNLFWDKIRADNILNQKVANSICDWYFNGGTAVLRIIQKLLMIQADGIFGDVTIQAINLQNPQQLTSRIADRRIQFYNTVVSIHPKDTIFLKGWINRANFYR